MRTSALKATPQLILSSALLTLAMLLGGGQGTLGDTLTQLIALGLIFVLYRNNTALRTWPKESLLVLIVLVPMLLFLFPWPDFLLYAGPARSQLQQLLQPVIGELSSSASLTPLATQRALLWLLPCCALYLSMLQSSTTHKRFLLAVLIFWVFIGSLVGLAQKAMGETSALYFYANTNFGSSVGFFANSNHYAICMAACLPLVWAGLIWLVNHRAEYRIHPLWFVLLCSIALMFILGFMLSDSRAGLVLGIGGCFLMLPAIIDADCHYGSKRWLFALLAIGLFIFLLSSLYFIRLQFQEDPLSDLRWKFAPIVQQAAQQFSPVGSGPGSFWFVFPQYEDFMSGNIIVNHAHNDYLELWLEMRWLFALPAILMALDFLKYGMRFTFKSSQYEPNSLLLARAAWVGVLLLLLHSMLDYPLRTTALSTMMAMFIALLVTVEPSEMSDS